MNSMRWTMVSQHAVLMVAMLACIGHALDVQEMLASYSCTKGDHPSMINDVERVEFYRRALRRVLADCPYPCTVLEVGAGSGVLSMLAAKHGAAHVIAIEADASAASLAKRNIERNRASSFPDANITVVEAFSSSISVAELPLARKVDVFMSELLGNEFFDENVMDIVADARDRLLKQGGAVIPAGGCQYVTLVEVPELEGMLAAGKVGALDLRGLSALLDPARKYPLATRHVNALSDRVCVTEVDFTRDGPEVLKTGVTFRMQASASGVVNAAMLDGEIWFFGFPEDKRVVLSTGRRLSSNSWATVLQPQQEADRAWQIQGKVPHPLVVEANRPLEIAVQYFVHAASVADVASRPNIEMRVLTRYAAKEQVRKPIPASAGRPLFAPLVVAGIADRADIEAANTLYLPLVSDGHWVKFYVSLMREALSARSSSQQQSPSSFRVLDATGALGVAGLAVAKELGVTVMVLSRSKQYGNLVKELAKKNGLAKLVDARTGEEIEGRYHALMVAPPMSLHDAAVAYDPGHVLNEVKQRALLEDDAVILPHKLCLEASLIDSEDLTRLFSVPGAHAHGFDFYAVNAEAVSKGILESPFLAGWSFGEQFAGNVSQKWLSEPACTLSYDLSKGLKTPQPAMHALAKAGHVDVKISSTGRGHAIVSHWVAVGSNRNSRPGGKAVPSLGPSHSSNYGRRFAWQSFVQPLSAPGMPSPDFSPWQLLEGQTMRLAYRIQGASELALQDIPFAAVGLRVSWRVHAHGRAAKQHGKKAEL